MKQKRKARKCVLCRFEINEKEIEMNLATSKYHRGCKANADDFTLDVPGALADLLRRTKYRCETDGLDYALGDDLNAMRLLLDMFESQDGLCEKTGIAMRCDTNHEYSFHLKPSIDRINNARGYHSDNIRLVIQWANLKRSDLTDEQDYRLNKASVEAYERRKRTVKSKRRGISPRQTSKQSKLR